jgi:hypothetical protein
MAALAAAERLETLRPELGTRPRVYYRNLHRYSSCFVGGSVCGLRAGVEECLAGAAVELHRGGQLNERGATDAFGEFRFDGLPANSGAWELRLSCAGFAGRVLPVELGAESVVLEAIALQPA